MNLHYSIDSIASITQGEIHKLDGTKENLIGRIIIDSRSFFGEKNVLFIAIKGKANDGHDYIPSLYEKGLRYFIVEDTFSSLVYKDAILIKVDNSIHALQALATYHRSQFAIPVIGITGSYGKTIVKEWLYHILKTKFNIIRSPKSFNSQIGVPLSVLQITDQHTLAIFEAGISHPGEMEVLQKIIAPTHGILTHIGEAHLENFENKDSLATEKRKLFLPTESIEKNVYDYSENTAHEVSHSIKNGKTLIHLSFEDHSFSIQIPFEDDASIQNAITCAGFLVQFGINPSLIANEMASLPSIALRLEKRQGKNNTIIINDSYSNDISSLHIALDFLERIKGDKEMCLVLSDIQHELVDPVSLYQEIATTIQQRGLKNFYGVGSELCKYSSLFKHGSFHTESSTLLDTLRSQKLKDVAILLKGGRHFGFEKIAHLLEEKVHETKLIIDLSALRNNVNQYRKLLAPETKMLCMVKAFGYGNGIAETGQLLAESNADYLGVAYADEGIALRNEKIDLPILVMNPSQGSFEEIIHHQLEPSIYSFRQLDQFIRTLIDHNITSYPIHIKIDTGMNRLGFSINDVEELASVIASQPEVRVLGIFSHLAASDMSSEDLFTQRQIELFEYATQRIEGLLGYACIKHILNTKGIERFTSAQNNMVRLGIGMYGISSGIPSIEKVSRLVAVISQIKTIKKGESVGYSRGQYATEDTIIGVIPIGYADGFRRCLSDGVGNVWINHHQAPVFGKVCMDMIMVNLNGIEAKEGDEAEIFGHYRSIEDFAEEMGTIPYEVMTSISQRVVRVYLD